jgi:aminoglycoside phosphotransferase family enzyme/predicted kinase
MASSSEVLLSALLDPAFYPHGPAEVNLVETHISWVFLAGDLVYKCKKPVKFDFLDFSTPDLRRRACEDEVRLNRRLAPDTYLGVVPVTQAGERLQLHGDGPVVEWLVEMRRLPTDQTLDHKLWQGGLRRADIRRLVELLVSFFHSQQPAPLTADKYRERFITHVQQNRQELLAKEHHLPEQTIKRIHAAQLALLQLNSDLFVKRVREGKVIEGHGDLRPEHICFADHPIIFDCLEFSPELRMLDIADELAFLAMECDKLGASWAGDLMFEQFQQATGEQTPRLLIDFYKSYRACVRAKVAAIRAEQLQGVSREAAICQARNYLLLADRYLHGASHPLLVAIGGLSGTGKSSLAQALGRTLGAEVLRSDVVRRQLYPEASAGPVGSGVYRPEARQRVYSALLQQAEQSLQARCPVILDATFAEHDQVWAAYELARQTSTPFLAVECTCPADVALQRIRARAAAASDPSQADEAVYRNQQEHWQPWPAEIPQLRVTTTESVPVTTQQVIDVLARMGMHAEAPVAS